MRRRTLFRRAIQALFFILFLGLLSVSIYLPHQGGILDFFFRINPLTWLVTLISSRAPLVQVSPPGLAVSPWTRILPPVVLLVLTLVVGRFFCAYICPMGTSLDLCDRLIGRRRRRMENYAMRLRHVKFVLLAFVLAAALFGVSFVYLLDPLAILNRAVSLAFYPMAVGVTNIGLDLLRPLAERFEWTELTYATIVQPHFALGLLALLWFGAIAALSLLQHRFWCRVLCPLGALLSWTSRRSRVRRRVSDACTQCGLCVRRCEMGAITEDPAVIARGECTLCGACADLCPEQAISFGSWKHIAVTTNPANPERRRILLGTGAAAAGVLLLKSDLFAGVRNPTLLRPPGSVPESHFLRRCVRCGNCVRVCPTNGLQMASLEAGWPGFLTPKLVPRVGGCERDCNRCGQVCPTMAIRPLPLEEKSYACIGTARIDRSRCIAWEQNRLCLICDEICPYGAIYFQEVVDETGCSPRPFIDERVCTGCGLCEQKCPVDGEAAIVVTPIGEERQLRGRYATEEKRRRRERARQEQLEELEDLSTRPEECEVPPGFIDS